jgi:hypothetical protein
MHELTLPDSGDSLFDAQVDRALLQIKFSASGPDSAGRNENNLVSGIFDVRQRPGKTIYIPEV